MGDVMDVQVPGNDGEAPAGHIQSLDKGLRILGEFIESPAPLKLADIFRKFDIDRASAFRFLQTLEFRGFLRKDPVTKEYDVGGRMYYWAARLREKTKLIDAFHDQLQRLAGVTQQTAHLGLFVNGRVLLADFAQSDSLISIRHAIGVLEPLHSSAVGKAILAFLPPDRQEKLISELTFTRFTDNTITDADTLRAEMALTRQRGYATDVNETHEGLTCVARPLFDAIGQPTASIGITSVTALMNAVPGRMEFLIRSVLELDTRIIAQDEL
ncbi:IclR family transcriptional regulator [Tabrizicola fusiformis]|uniref:IclR family transcriptional regulator n=1 Tax=Tabrizicola sp. SY72 TaxID=2741673 RepID=UPI001572C567|nr:IclR family transcriptional regulator [Tabrizicola sp. SY72]NTT86078.1 IclR family transcriptional regulator [Tabrizicola sp. SY72]